MVGRKRAFNIQNMKTLRFDVPEAVYWEAKRLSGYIKANSWAVFFAKAVLLMKKLEEEGKVEEMKKLELPREWTSDDKE